MMYPYRYPNPMSPTLSPSEMTSDDEIYDYDFIDLSTRSHSLDSSLADFHPNVAPLRISLASVQIQTSQEVFEPPASVDACEAFPVTALTPEDIQAYVRGIIPAAEEPLTPQRGQKNTGTVRLYVDGAFDILHAGLLLHLRQAKLSFPSVHLMVGVFPDDHCPLCAVHPLVPHVERCEAVRHCRWVDEVIPDAPRDIDETFLRKYDVDYVAVLEEIVDERYEFVRSKGQLIETRKTTGLIGPTLWIRRPENVYDD